MIKLKQIYTKSLLENIYQNKIGRNTIWMLMGHGGRVFLQGLYIILLARTLGVEQFGVYAGALALVFILSPFAGWGSGKLLIMHVARNPASFPVYWGNALIAVWVSGCIFTLIILLIGPSILPNMSLNILILMAITEFFFGKLYEISTEVFQAHELLLMTAKLNILINALRFGAVVVFINFASQTTLYLWIWCYLLSTILAALIGLFMVHLKFGAPRPCLILLKRNYKDGFYFALGLASYSIYNDIDKTMLLKFSSSEATGIYTIAYRIIAMAFLPVMALLNSCYAHFFKEGNQGIKESFKFAKRLLPFSVSYGIVAVLVLIAFAPIIPFLLGKDYNQSVEAIRWLSLLVLFQSIYYFLADALTGAGYQKVRSAIQMGAALLNVCLNLLLIPLYSWKGAIWASITTDGVLIITFGIAVMYFIKSQNARGYKVGFKNMKAGVCKNED
ncbi:MAG: hypothetical protein VR72_04110 [Clostridiaceae bacterium BRH_c20a]|nr:MAG: hypothetical protein VR72_04110 [Clostridiaceae bacterium BRH_c20a]